jgi:hypothetical protein
MKDSLKFVHMFKVEYLTIKIKIVQHASCIYGREVNDLGL